MATGATCTSAGAVGGHQASIELNASNERGGTMIHDASAGNNSPKNASSGNARLCPGASGKNAGTEPGDPGGWHSRGYLPHFDSSEVTQHVTFHLADSLPADAVAHMAAELDLIDPEKRDTERRRRMEALIDAGHGSCLLREPRHAQLVQTSLLAFDSTRYRLLAWVVMPNHVHVLFQTCRAGAWRRS